MRKFLPAGVACTSLNLVCTGSIARPVLTGTAPSAAVELFGDRVGGRAMAP